MPVKTQDIVDLVGTSVFHTPPSWWDKIARALPVEKEWDVHHPKGEREGSVERLIKSLAPRLGTMVGNDFPYLEQYIHPNSDVLTKTKPPPFVKDSKLTFREPSYDTGSINGENSGLHFANTGGLGNYTQVDPKDGTRVSSDYSLFDTHPTKADLSHVYDTWDFDTAYGMMKDENHPSLRVLSPLAREIMKRSGTPYGIYGPYFKHDK